MRQRERDRTTIAILASAVGEVGPPFLAVALDSTNVMGVDDEVSACDNEPGGLALDEDNAVRVVWVEPVLNVWTELEAEELSDLVCLLALSR